MSKSFIILGSLNLKYLLPFFLAILQVVFIIINRYYEEEHNNLVLQMYMLSLGEMSIKLLTCIIVY